MPARLILINRSHTRLWFGQAVSTLGDAVFSTTLVLWVATVLTQGRSWAPAAVGGVVLATGAAVVFVGPLAGVFVDRWSKRGTMLCSEVIRGALATVLAIASLLPVHELPIGVWLVAIYAIVFTLNAAGQFFSPARFAVIGDLMTDDADRTRAAGAAEATNQLAWIIGPPLAAPLLFSVGLQWALLVNAVSYAVSFIAIRSIGQWPAEDQPGESQHRPGLRREFMAGLRFYGGNRILVALLVLAVIGQCGIGALNTLNIFFVTGNLHTSAHLYGYLGMAFGLGGITGALCTGLVTRRLSAQKIIWMGLLATGALLVVYSRQTEFAVGAVLLLVIAIPLTMLNTAMSPLLLTAAPRDYLGRVMAVFHPVTKLSGMLSAALVGWLASSGLRDFEGSLAGVRLGPVDTIFTVSGLLVVAAGVYAWKALPDSVAVPEPAPAAHLGGTR